MSYANDAPLSPQAVDRAIALLRGGHSCRTKWRLWSCTPDGRFWSTQWAAKDNEWVGGFVTEEQMRAEIAEHSAAFRDLLAAAL